MAYTCSPQLAAHGGFKSVCRAKGIRMGRNRAYSEEFCTEIQKFGKDIIENAPRSSKNKRMSYITVNDVHNNPVVFENSMNSA